MDYKEYDSAISQLAEKINQHNVGGGLKNIYGIPRGGYYPAIKLSQLCNLPIITDEQQIDYTTLLVDDICDSGETLMRYKEKNPVPAVVILFEDESGKRSVYPEYGITVSHQDGWINIPDEKGEGIEDNIRRIFQYIGEDPDRIGLKGTPDRIVRMWKEIFRGYDPNQKPKITTFPNGEDGLTYDNMIVDEGNYYSECEHHMMPFFGHYWFAYIPNPKGRILGISKVGRVVDYCAAKLQVQERLTKEVVDMLADALGAENPPLGVALVMRGQHLCKSMRGVKKEGFMTSSYLTGIFHEEAVRSEFMNFVNRSRL